MPDLSMVKFPMQGIAPLKVYSNELFLFQLTNLQNLQLFYF